MLHLVLYGLLAVIVAVGLFLIATRFLPAGEQIAPSLRDEPPWDLPAARTLDANDVDAVRLPVALRGYRFAETDLLLDRLATELRTRDEEIARLKGHAAPPDGFDDAGGVDLEKRPPAGDAHEQYAPPPPTLPPESAVSESTVSESAPSVEEPSVEEPSVEPSDPDQPGAGRS